MIPDNPSFAEYLTAKRSIDDRSLNRRIFDAFAQALAEFRHPRIVEPGCGVGTMPARLIEWGVFTRGEYVGMDTDAELIQVARSAFEREPHPDVRFEQSDALDYFASIDEPFHALIAHAFMDLVDIPTALEAMLRALVPGGLFYITLVFDGMTAFVPADELDALVLNLYHRSMDERTIDGLPSGSSRSGRVLLEHLTEADAELIETGASDWVVVPGGDGYSADEDVFMRFILHTIRSELSGHPELPQKDLMDWLDRRHQQFERAELSFLAHQLDFFGRVR